MTTGDGLAMMGLLIAVGMVVSSIVIATAWMDTARRAGSHTELTPPSQPPQSGRKR